MSFQKKHMVVNMAMSRMEATSIVNDLYNNDLFSDEVREAIGVVLNTISQQNYEIGVLEEELEHTEDRLEKLIRQQNAV